MSKALQHLGLRLLSCLFSLDLRIVAVGHCFGRRRRSSREVLVLRDVLKHLHRPLDDAHLLLRSNMGAKCIHPIGLVELQRKQQDMMPAVSINVGGRCARSG